MSVFKDIIYDIQDELRRGDLSFREIAERYDVSLSSVEEILQDLMDQEQDYEPDYEDDGDALASAGFGTDEDYGYYGDE